MKKTESSAPLSKMALSQIAQSETPMPLDAHKTGDTADMSRVRLWLNMLRTTRYIENTLRERFKTDFDATLPRFDVMASLFRNPDGMTMTHLSESLMVSNGNVTGIVERLVDEGLVNRTAHDTDRRTAIVHLTPDGLSTFSVMAKEHHAWIDELLKSIPGQEIAHLTDLLQGLRDAQTVHQKRTRQAKRKKRDQ